MIEVDLYEALEKANLKENIFDDIVTWLGRMKIGDIEYIGGCYGGFLSKRLADIIKKSNDFTITYVESEYLEMHGWEENNYYIVERISDTC